MIMELDKSAIYMWHGGKRLEGTPEIRPPKEGRYEAGPGFYTTNNYHTALKYSKGGGATFLLKINPHIRLADETYIPLDVTINFVKNVTGMKNKKSIIDDLIDHSERMKSDKILADVLINLVVNWRSGSGRVGVSVAAFLVSQGVDASLETHMSMQSNQENWLVIYNPRIIESVKKMPSKDVSPDMYYLPALK